MKSIAVFSGSKLGQGRWRPGKKFRSIAFFGGSEIDFRQAELEEGVTEVMIFAMFGGTKVIVPKDIPVTLSGFSIFGGRGDKRSQAKDTPLDPAKALNIKAINIFGGFAITD